MRQIHRAFLVSRGVAALAALSSLAAASGCDDDVNPLPAAPLALDGGSFVIDGAVLEASAPEAGEAGATLPDAAPTGCTPPAGPGTTHGGSVNAPETWTAAGSPHHLLYDTGIYAPLTVEACAVVLLPHGTTVTINQGGALIAAGTPGRPVTFDAEVAGASWATLRALGGDLSLVHAIVRSGGAPLNTNPALTGAIYMQRSGNTGTLHLDDVEIDGSQSNGVYLNSDGPFDATSQNLRVHGAASFPINAYARIIGSIPTGVYTGNAHDVIAIAGTGGPVLDAQTLHDRGVPYHVGSGSDGGRMDVNAQVASSVAVLTIEPGVTVQFTAGGTLYVEPASGDSVARGALVAIGTVDKPIVFTSDRGAASAAGDWLGLGFGGLVDPRTVLQHVRVEFAGGPNTGSTNSCGYPGRTGQNDAAIRIFGPPSTQFITETEIVSSARDGIDRGWRADLQPDFLASNTFTNVAGCKESTPRTANGVCPANPACP